MRILEGAERTVRESALAIICEVEFCELYRGQKLFSDVEVFLRERGFSFFGFTHLATRSRKGLTNTIRLAVNVHSGPMQCSSKIRFPEAKFRYLHLASDR